MHKPLSVKLVVFLASALLIALGNAALADITISGRVISGSEALAGVTISGQWAGLATPRQFESTTDSQGRFSLTLSATELGETKSVALFFDKAGYDRAEQIFMLRAVVPEDFDVAMTRAGLPPPSAEFESFEPFKSHDGNTVFVTPYRPLSESDTALMGELSRNLSAHLRMRIGPTTNAWNASPISFVGLDSSIDISNLEKIRRLGSYLNGLAVVGGEGSRQPAVGGASKVELMSNFALPVGAGGGALPVVSYIHDIIPAERLSSVTLGEQLDDIWVHRTLMALADKELRSGPNSDDLNRIESYLMSARTAASNQQMISEIDSMIARVGEARP